MTRARSLAVLAAVPALLLSLLGGISPAGAATVRGASYFPVTPNRLLDTRVGTGAPAHPIGPGGSVDLTVIGVGGVPILVGATGVPDGVRAVVLNVTATDATAPDSFLTVYPAGTPRPLASNLNVKAGTTATNLVKVSVSTTGEKIGKVTIYNNTGSVSVVVDVSGWYAVGTGGTYNQSPARRVLDTRNGRGGTSGAVSAGQTIDLPLDLPGASVTGISAVVLNVTAIHAGGPESYLTVFPAGTDRPLASNLNFLDRAVVPNLVIVRLGANGKVSIYNNLGLAHIVADVQGYYTGTDTPSFGSTYFPLAPARDLDTRTGTGTGGTIAKLGAGQTLEFAVTGVNGVPTTEVTAVVLNVTAVDHSGADSYLTVYSGLNRPFASNLNFVAGQTVANLVVVPVVAGGKVLIYNNRGSVDVAADIQGWFRIYSE